MNIHFLPIPMLPINHVPVSGFENAEFTFVCSSIFPLHKDPAAPTPRRVAEALMALATDIRGSLPANSMPPPPVAISSASRTSA